MFIIVWSRWKVQQKHRIDVTQGPGQMISFTQKYIAPCSSSASSAGGWEASWSGLNARWDLPESDPSATGPVTRQEGDSGTYSAHIILIHPQTDNSRQRCIPRCTAQHRMILQDPERVSTDMALTNVRWKENLDQKVSNQERSQGLEKSAHALEKIRQCVRMSSFASAWQSRNLPVREKDQIC